MEIGALMRLRVWMDSDQKIWQIFVIIYYELENSGELLGFPCVASVIIFWSDFVEDCFEFFEVVGFDVAVGAFWFGFDVPWL